MKQISLLISILVFSSFMAHAQSENSGNEKAVPSSSTLGMNGGILIVKNNMEFELVSKGKDIVIFATTGPNGQRAEFGKANITITNGQVVQHFENIPCKGHMYTVELNAKMPGNTSVILSTTINDQPYTVEWNNN